MKTKKLLVNTNQQNYPIFIGSGLISNLKKIIKKESINYMKCLIVVDKNISIKKNQYNKKGAK